MILSLLLLNYSHSANHTNFNINAEDNDFSGLDFSELDRLAGYEEGGEETAGGEGEVEVHAEAGEDSQVVETEAPAEGGAAESGN